MPTMQGHDQGVPSVVFPQTGIPDRECQSGRNGPSRWSRLALMPAVMERDDLPGAVTVAMPTDQGAMKERRRAEGLASRQPRGRAGCGHARPEDNDGG